VKPRFAIFSQLYIQLTGILGRGSARRNAATYTGKRKQNKRTQTSMSRVGFETMIPVFLRAKTFYALDRAATGIGCVKYVLH
jgi:hypothetical protein